MDGQQHQASAAIRRAEAVLRLLVRRWPISFGLPLAVGAAVYVAMLWTPALYEAEAVVTVSTVNYGGKALALQSIAPVGLTTFFRDPQVLQAAIAAHRLKEDYGLDENALRGRLLSVSAPRDTDTIRVTVLMRRPDLARDVANTVVRKAIETYLKTMEGHYQRMVEKLKAEDDAAFKAVQSAEEQLRNTRVQYRLETLIARLDMRRLVLTDSEKHMAELKTVLEIERRAAKANEANPAKDGLDAAAAQGPTSWPSRQGWLEVEIQVCQESVAAIEKEIRSLEDVQFQADRQISEMTYLRDKAQLAASSASDALQEVRNVPMWPAQRLNMTPALAPDHPYWPRKGLLSLGALLASFAITALVLVRLHGKD